MPASLQEKERRKEIHQTLTALNPKGRLRLRNRLAKTRPPEKEHSQNLRAAFQKLGPLFCCFGIYLSSRVDLLPFAYINEFRLIPDQAEPMPTERIREIIQQELGNPPEVFYAAFEEYPFESRLTFQSHNAWLQDGTPVTVKISRAAMTEHLFYDSEMIAAAAKAFEALGLKRWQLDSAVSDFRQSLDYQLNLKYQAEAIDRLCAESGEFESIQPLVTYTELSTTRVLTMRRLIDADDPATIVTPELARRLTVTWLRLALMGSVLPVEPAMRNVRSVGNTQIAFTEGLFARLSAESKMNIWRYLVAASNSDADTACTFLLRELERSRTPTDPDQLRRALRQAVSFR